MALYRKKGYGFVTGVKRYMFSPRIEDHFVPRKVLFLVNRSYECDIRIKRFYNTLRPYIYSGAHAITGYMGMGNLRWGIIPELKSSPTEVCSLNPEVGSNCPCVNARARV